VAGGVRWLEGPVSDGGCPVTGYALYRSLASGGESLLGRVGAAARSAEDRTCPLRETCTYRMAAVNAVGEGTRTGAISVIGNTGVPATPVLTASAGPGSTRLEIADVATTGKADLIVMGSHGRTGFSKLLLGSVAAHVVAHAPCSVLVVKGGESTG